MVESEEELKNHMIKVKEESEKVGLKLNRAGLRAECWLRAECRA